ncbi:hypothetical protein CDD83_6821 [Cordyceps sp. RAO-2017]|nr:hypothetical protein CDD83_6821 [Cordyceps sp. RAO-2017]
MASSTKPDARATSYVEMQDGTDASLIGKHCQYEHCNQLDFLPFLCQSCTKTFCLDHRTESAHRCDHPGAWAERRRLAQLSKPSIGQDRTLRDRVAQKPCASPDCKTVVGTSLTPGVHCRTCNRDYCLKHRLQEDHDCKNLTPVGARPANADVGQRTRSALDKLRAWGAAKKAQAEKAFPGAPKPRPRPSPATRLMAVNKLKRTAKGRANIAEEKRIYLHVEATEPVSAQAKLPKGDLFFSRDWVVGKLLDDAAQSLQITNINNRSDKEEDRLRVFHVEGGRLLEFNEKIDKAVESGDTVVLVRGIGPAPSLMGP